MQHLRLENTPIAYHIEECECQEWIVFLHAAFVNSGMFKRQFEYFSGKYNIIAVDILGHGGSLDVKKGDSIEDMSNWINNILQKHNVEKAHFVGVSLGSVLAQDFAYHFESKVASLACFGGYDMCDFDETLQKGNSKAQMGLILKGMFSIKAFAKANKRISAYTEQAQEEFYNLNLNFKKKSFMCLADLHKLVNRLPKKKRNYPLLIGCGEFDLPMEIDIVNSWAEKEKCEKYIFNGAGHCVNMDKPEEFNNLLQDFWGKI